MRKDADGHFQCEECTQGQENTHCIMQILRFWKMLMRRTFLREIYGITGTEGADPDISPGDVQGMTMREIRNRIEETRYLRVMISETAPGVELTQVTGMVLEAETALEVELALVTGIMQEAETERGNGTGAGNGYGMNGTGAHHQESYGEHGAGHGRRHRE